MIFDFLFKSKWERENAREKYISDIKFHLEWERRFIQHDVLPGTPEHAAAIADYKARAGYLEYVKDIHTEKDRHRLYMEFLDIHGTDPWPWVQNIARDAYLKWNKDCVKEVIPLARQISKENPNRAAARALLLDAVNTRYYTRMYPFTKAEKKNAVRITNTAYKSVYNVFYAEKYRQAKAAGDWHGVEAIRELSRLNDPPAAPRWYLPPENPEAETLKRQFPDHKESDLPKWLLDPLPVYRCRHRFNTAPPYDVTYEILKE